MKLAITARIRRLFDRYSVRITIGVLFSLLMHGFILSLQLGFPGIGLPGLGLPWSERRAQTPDISIRIANVAGSPTVQQQAAPAVESESTPKPQEAVTTNDQPLTELPNARVKQAPTRTASVSAPAAKALKSSPAIAQTVRKIGSPPPDDQSSPAPARSQTELIALTGDRPSAFTVPEPDPDSWWRAVPKVDSTPLPIHPPEEAAPPAIALQNPKQTIQRSQEPAPALQKPSEQESFERPEETKAKEPEPSKTTELATEISDRKQGEEIAAQDAARKAEQQEAAQRAQDNETRKQVEARQAEETSRQMAAKKLEEQQLARRDEEAAEKKAEEEKERKQEEADRQSKELAARKQAEEIARQQAAALALQRQQEEARLEETKRQEQAKAEQQRAAELAARKQAKDLARQKAAAIEKEKQEEQLAAQQKAQELAAQQKAEELAARQKADAEAALQRENARAAAAAAATAAASKAGSKGGSPGTTAGTSGAGNQPKGTSAGSLTSKALADVGKIDLSRLAPPNDANRPEEDSRRRSIFGMIDHDVVVDAYIRDWRNKIERNGPLNYSQSSKDRAREDPVVTVAIRSDGSVEEIVINRSSGVRELDEAVKRIVTVTAPYGAFPASLARKYPVIEIRRVWNFDETLRILEEVH